VIAMSNANDTVDDSSPYSGTNGTVDISRGGIPCPLVFRNPDMNKDQYLHVVRVDIDPKVEGEFNEWYEAVHIPALLGCPGWVSARRYVALDGGPKYAAVYEIAAPWAYDTPEYLEVKGFKEFEPYIRNFIRLRLGPIAPVAASTTNEFDEPPS
jgi:hypothetical protein